MLTKRQLEDAVRCINIKIEECSMKCHGHYKCLKRTAQTALAYMDMLERVVDGISQV